MANEKIASLQRKYGADIFDPIDAVRFREEFRNVYLENKYNSGTLMSRIRSYGVETLYRFVTKYYVDILSLSRHRLSMEVSRMTTEERKEYFKKNDLGLEFMENCIRMIPIWRKQQEEKPLGERD